MDTNSKRGNLVIGGLLIALGVFFLAGMLFQQVLGGLDWSSLWPLIIVGVGGLLLVTTFLGGRATSGLAIPGSVVTTVGGILWFQNSFGYWESWSYAWGLIIVAVGAGLVIHGQWGGHQETVRSGFGTIGLGLALFLVFGAMTEFIFSVHSTNHQGLNVLFPIGMALLGGYLFLRDAARLARRAGSDDRPRTRANLFWPVMMIGLGVLWSLAMLGVTSGEQTLALLGLWPVALVLIGLDLIVGRRSPWVGAVLAGLLVAGMFAFVILGRTTNLSERAPWLFQGISMGGPAGWGVTGNGQVATEERAVQRFISLDLRGQGTIELVQGEQESLVVEAEANLLPYIVTRVAGSELVIETKNGATLHPTQPIRYRVTVKDLRAITISGSGDASMPALQTGDLELRINGSGSIRIDALQAQSLRARINGSGDIELAGQVDSLEMKINGSGDFNAAGLSAGQVEVDIPGSGEVVVWATDTLDVAISGSGKVDYYGDPQVRQSGHTSNVRPLGVK